MLREKRRSLFRGRPLQSIRLDQLPFPSVDTNCANVITLIGGGGKTGLMHLWARTLCDRGLSVITTTTTKLCNKPQPGFSFAQPATLAEAQTLLDEARCSHQVLTLTGKLLPAEGKFCGIPCDWIDQLSHYSPQTHFFVEGDGSAGRSLKAHMPHEPVIPGCTSLLIPVLGLDVIGKPLNDSNVHRVEVFARITGRKPGNPVDPSSVLSIFLHEEGYLRQVPEKSTVMPFLNKAEGLHSCKDGLNLANRLLSASRLRMDSVLVGSVWQNCFVRLT